MTIPFLSYFKKAKKERSAPEPVSAMPLEKPSSERFSKTVMPNTTRTLPVQEPSPTAEGAPAGEAPASVSPSVPSGPPKARTISFGPSAPTAGRPRDLPPAVALAFEPKVERVISLDLADVAQQIPAEYIKPLESIDGTRRILVKASEVEKGMATGRPAVSLATIYQQVPEIFLRTIASVDDAQVYLPFEKVLKQFSSLQVRGDQEKHRAVPQVETPFLQATLEDNTRFGTTTEVGVETGDLPPVRIELATAEAYAAAEPEANGFVLKPATEGTSPPPTRIPLQFSPNGTGGPAPESVPASSGPSVPTAQPPGVAPTRIPFNAPAPSEKYAADEPWLTAENLPAPAKQAAASTLPSDSKVKIKLALKPILQALPPFQLKGDVGRVPAEASIDLPFSLIEPQLATGRIALAPAAFEAALPDEYRSLFNATDEPADVILPLQDVLKNLPSNSLPIRADQETPETGTSFVTPFSAKAEEDAKRFNLSGAAAEKPPVAPPAQEQPEQQPVAVSQEKPFDLSQAAPVPPPVESDKTVDAKAVVAELNKLPGVQACAFLFGDGLGLAGNLPAEYETEGLCAMGASLMQRIESHMVETKLGALNSMTLSCSQGAITFFLHQNLCLAAFHASNELTAEVRQELVRAVHELSGKYSHPV